MIPKIIKNDEEHKAFLVRMGQLMESEPGTPEGDELELIALLVEKYEESNYAVTELPDPITAIRFRMEQQKLKDKDLVPFIGSKSKVSEVLSGKRELSLAMIRKLVKGLGIPAEVLLQEKGATLPKDALLDIGLHFPFAEMLKRGWLSSAFGSMNEIRDQIEDVIADFVKPVSTDICLRALHRQQVRHGRESDNSSLHAWQIRVVSRAIQTDIPEYKLGTVTPQFVTDIVKLSYFDNGPRLASEMLRKNGIHLIIEDHLPKTYLDGAAMKLSDNSRLIALTLRHDRLDNFWFTLCHELAHVALHLDRNDITVFYDDLEVRSSDNIENEADEFARDSLISAEAWNSSGLLDEPTEKRLFEFANRHRIHPAIPAGRVRYELNNYRIFSGYLKRQSVRKQFLPQDL